MDVLNLPDKGKARGSRGSGLGTIGGITILNTIKKVASFSLLMRLWMEIVCCFV